MTHPIIRPTYLKGSSVRLEPLSLAHHDDLVEAASINDLWKVWYATVPNEQGMKAEIERRLALQDQLSMLPFAVIDQAFGKAVGMTSFANVDAINLRAEIGFTWYSVTTQRTPINTEAKFLLLQHAFEKLNCIAVELRTHFLNHQSRRAIERLGAKLDGILRNHTRTKNGALRDTCVYSIIQSEWPTIKVHLQWLMDKPR